MTEEFEHKIVKTYCNHPNCTGHLITTGGQKAVFYYKDDMCPTCGSDDPMVRKLVPLPDDELCPNQQWDYCEDSFHPVISNQQVIKPYEGSESRR